MVGRRAQETIELAPVVRTLIAAISAMSDAAIAPLGDGQSSDAKLDRVNV